MADTYGYKLKAELCNTAKLSSAGKKALLYGLMLFSRSFNSSGISIQTEYECVATLYQDLLHELCGAEAKLRVMGTEAKAFAVSVLREIDRQRVLEYFAHEFNEIALKVNMANIDTPEDICHFIRGAFLACGYVSDPHKAYRLEFVEPRFTLSRNLALLLEDAGFTFKSSVRKGSYVLYVKDSGVIEDVITYMGASRFTLELMDIKIIKDLRNNINRKTNCETANIEKTITASAAQIRDIKYLKKALGLALLPEELREIALLRIKYPESSLSELGQMLKPPLSRSGVSHRLRRLSAMAKEQKQLIKK
ncbi:DNA-binding protein WhiA [Acetanaerobacterium elongatum]|uniref:Probable cell division protein WhiA n=1 Tax=Acetanaerobacterium elongatum TaxID=258515 RepID=A0A1H0AUN3_9FIRM|nr:DNA-binding protein WhiA [Acetanaerobacterium elongatum]SDN36783.1 hypothetical protein SAMN05192585_11737 [Acetanaerobacterium elongatum]